MLGVLLRSVRRSERRFFATFRRAIGDELTEVPWGPYTTGVGLSVKPLRMFTAAMVVNVTEQVNDAELAKR
jgi:hypothetical protein